MNNFQTHSQHQNTTNQQTQSNFQQPNFNAQNQTTSQQPSALMKIVGAVLPAILEQFTGQNLASGSPSANNMEMQLALSQVLTLQQQIVTSQQELTRRVINLETRASQQFNGLFQQVKNLSSVRLTHEKKQIELHGNGNYQQQQENHEN